LNFFRDPERSTPREEGMIISPADGTVVLIREVEEPEYLCSRATQISIFMSPLNVHVNRFPISGKVGYFKHVEGAYMVAFHEKSSVLNERTLIGVEENSRRVLFKQIAGAVARRIVAEVQVGDEVRRGERFGMIKFGSRVDVLVPNDVALSVRLHDKVVAGETVLGRFGGA
jgi:phosphatidylserine decarboxylase